MHMFSFFKNPIRTRQKIALETFRGPLYFPAFITDVHEAVEKPGGEIITTHLEELKSLLNKTIQLKELDPSATILDKAGLRRDIIVGLCNAPHARFLLGNLAAFDKITWSHVNLKTIHALSYGNNAVSMLENPKAVNNIINCYHLNNVTKIIEILAEAPNTPLLLENSAEIKKVLGNDKGLSTFDVLNGLRYLAYSITPESLHKLISRADDVALLSGNVDSHKHAHVLEYIVFDKNDVLINNAERLRNLLTADSMGVDPAIASYNRVQLLGSFAIAPGSAAVFNNYDTVLRIAEETGLNPVKVVTEIAASQQADLIIASADSVIAYIKLSEAENSAKSKTSALQDITSSKERIPASGRFTASEEAREEASLTPQK